MVVREWRTDKITAAEAMKRLLVKPNTFYRRVKEWGHTPILLLLSQYPNIVSGFFCAFIVVSIDLNYLKATKLNQV